MSEKNTKLVYSTSTAIPRKEKKDEDSFAPELEPSRQKVIVRLDRKHRGGKSVTLIEGLVMPAKERETLLKRLKTALGTGGTVKASSLEIQGDHCAAVLTALTDMGYRPKRSGN